MFLIEYSKGCFIDGEDIQWLKVEKDKVLFILKSEFTTQIAVDAHLHAKFLNHMQAINDNMDSVETMYHNAKKDKLTPIENNITPTVKMNHRSG